MHVTLHESPKGVFLAPHSFNQHAGLLEAKPTRIILSNGEKSQGVLPISTDGGGDDRMGTKIKTQKMPRASNKILPPPPKKKPS